MAVGASFELPIGAGEDSEVVVDTGADDREDWREAHADAAEQHDGVWAVDGVGDAEGADESADGWRVEARRVEPGAEARAEVGAKSGQAEVGFETAAAAVGADGD